MEKNATTLKSLMMLFVVLGHSGIIYTGWWSEFTPTEKSVFFCELTKWLDSFHVYAFVFISGAIFYYLKYNKRVYREPLKIISKKAKRLLIPYIITCCIWAMPIDKATTGRAYSELIKKYVLGYSPAQLWFLLMLFFVFIIAVVVTTFVDIEYTSKGQDLIVILGGYILYLVSIVLKAGGIPNLFQILSAFTYELFFLSGMLAEKYYYSIEKAFKKTNIVLCELLFALLSIGGCYMCGNGIIGKVKYLILPLVNIAGVCFWVILITWIMNTTRLRLFTETNQKTRSISKVWQVFGKNSFYIYLIHQQIIYLVLPIVNISGMPPVIVVLTTFLLALVGSLVLWKCLSSIGNIFTNYYEAL